MSNYLTLTPRDPLIARDSRPFGRGQGNRMKALDWIYPSVLAGSLRTLLGKKKGGFNSETVKALKQLTIAGPLPLINNQLFVAAPLDIASDNKSASKKVFRLRPSSLSEGEGADFPGELLPVLLPESVTEEFKPTKIPKFWSIERMTQWLCESSQIDETFENALTQANTKDFLQEGFWWGPEHEERVHVNMDASNGASEDGGLYITGALDFNPLLNSNLSHIQIAVRVDAQKLAELIPDINDLHPLGGERRLVHWQYEPVSKIWECPAAVKSALAKQQRVRMVLATPGLFEKGWKPGWLNGSGEGSPPNSGVKLRLIGVCLERWQAISGWSLEQGKEGHKPLRRLVPAGGVYFFQVIEGKAEALAERWLQSVSDDPQDQRDGFGLALWGVWDEHKTGE